MSAVSTADIVVVLTEALDKKARLVSELASVKEAFEADSTMANFRLYYHKKTELDRHSTKVILLEGWSAGLNVDGVAR